MQWEWGQNKKGGKERKERGERERREMRNEKRERTWFVDNMLRLEI